MAIRLDAAADRVYRTSDILNQNAAFTVMFWFRPVAVATGTGQCLFAISAGTYNANGDEIYLRSSAANLANYAVVGASTQQQNGTTTIVANTYYHLAYVRLSAALSQLYLNGATEGSANTLDVSARAAATRQEIGGWASTNDEPFNGRIYNPLIYQRALSQAEIQAQMYRRQYISDSMLYGWYPTPSGSARADDAYTTGRNWTVGGTLTDEADPTEVPIYEQEGFRFRNDDGSESGATWLAGQDTNVSIAAGTNVRLRTLVNATNDPAAGQYQLEYKKSTDAAWKKVVSAQ